MKVFSSNDLASAKSFFEVLLTTDRTQIAVMVLGEGEVSGEYGTDHPQADQTLYVLEGAGLVRCEGEEKVVNAGDVIVIPAGAKHQVVGPNRTLNVYSPVAYPEEA